MLKRILATLPLCSLAGCGLFLDQLAPKNDAASVDASMDAMAVDAGAASDAYARVELDAFVRPDALVSPDVPVVPDAYEEPDAYEPDAYVVPDAFVPPDASLPPVTIDGVICSQRSFGGHAYILCDTDVNWDQANMACASRGFHMVKIETPEENTFVMHQAMTLNWRRRGGVWENVPRLWIGLRDEAFSGDWRWTDRSPLGPAFWYPSEPSPGERCVEMRGWGGAPFTFGWNNSSCFLPGRAYLCENDTP